MPKFWKWWKEAKDIWEAIALAIGAAGAVAVIATVVVLAFVGAIRNLSLSWHIAFIAALSILGLVFLRVSGKVIPLLQFKWNPFRRQEAIRCDGEHLTTEQHQLLGWANTQRLQDIERTNEYIRTEVTIILESIYSFTDPIVRVHFDIISSALHRVVVGAEVKGYVFSDNRLGDTPKTLLDEKGSSITLSLDRGQGGRFTLEQHITPDLRNMWLKNRLGKVLNFDLSRLFISAQLANPYVNGFVRQFNLQFDPNAKATLTKVADWPWHESPWREYAGEQPG